MTKGIWHLFTDIKSMAEDVHAIAAEGQCRDNAVDMQLVLISQLRMTVAAMRGKMGEIRQRLGDAHD